MEFCKCARLSALLLGCYLLRETKCHWKFGSVSTLTMFVKNSRRPQKHRVKLSPNLRDIPALSSIVFRAGAEPKPASLCFWLCDFPPKLVNPINLRLSYLCI